VLLFGLAPSRFDPREPLLDVGTRRAFVTDQSLEFDLTVGGSRLRGQTVCLKRLPGLIEYRRQLTGLATKSISGLGSLCQLGVELCLTLGQQRGSRRHGRRVLLFRLAPSRFDPREPLLDVGARRAFVTDQSLEFDLTVGGSRLRGQTVSAGVVVGVPQRRRRLGQLPLKGAPDRRGFGELRGELGFAVRKSLDRGGMCLKRLPGPIECCLQLTRFAAKGVSGIGSLCQFGVELRLSFGPIRRCRRHGRRVLLFRFAQGGFDLCEPLLDVGARRAFVTDQPLEFNLTFAGSRLSG
jgi:hypothetical protein